MERIGVSWADGMGLTPRALSRGQLRAIRDRPPWLLLLPGAESGSSPGQRSLVLGRMELGGTLLGCRTRQQDPQGGGRLLGQPLGVGFQVRPCRPALVRSPQPPPRSWAAV